MEKIKRTFGFIFTHPLGKRHYFKTLSRFLIWQLQCLFSPTKFRVKWFIGSVKFYARKGLTGVTGNIYSGLHEFGDMAFLLHFLREDDMFYDIGANVGSYTLLASGVCKSKSISVEPVKSTFNILANNIALNKLQFKVILINSGVGAESGTIAFSFDEDTTNHVIAEGELTDNLVNVPVTTVDSLLTNGAPSLIKIDVEGYETPVLKGMRETLLNPALKAIIIELNGSGMRYGFDEAEIHNLLMDNGFDTYKYDPFSRLLTKTTLSGNQNALYCRDISVIIDRVKTAKAIHIMGETF